MQLTKLPEESLFAKKIIIIIKIKNRNKLKEINGEERRKESEGAQQSAGC